MTLFQSIILGVVEGITEFLPISSTGHLILTSWRLGLSRTDFQKSFEIAIQLGAIAAVSCSTGADFSTLRSSRKSPSPSYPRASLAWPYTRW